MSSDKKPKPYLDHLVCGNDAGTRKPPVPLAGSVMHSGKESSGDGQQRDDYSDHGQNEDDAKDEAPASPRSVLPFSEVDGKEAVKGQQPFQSAGDEKPASPRSVLPSTDDDDEEALKCLPPFRSSEDAGDEEHASPRTMGSSSDDDAKEHLQSLPPFPEIGVITVTNDDEVAGSRTGDCFDEDKLKLSPSFKSSMRDKPEQDPDITSPEQFRDGPITAEVEVVVQDDPLHDQVDALQTQMRTALQPQAYAEVTNQKSKTASLDTSESRRRRRLIALILLALIAIMAAVIAGVVVATRSSSTEDDPTGEINNKTTNPPVSTPPVTVPPETLPPETNMPTPETPPNWKRIGQTLKATASPDLGIAKFLGHTLSLSRDGTTVVIGSASSKGGAAAYRLNTTTQIWTPMGKKVRGRGDFRFAWSVAANGDGSIMAVGAPPRYGVLPNRTGYVGVYQYNASSSEWNQLGSDIVGIRNGDSFGEAVSLSEAGDVVAVGIPEWEVGAGAVRVFKREGNSDWQQIGQDLTGEAFDDLFGASISLSNSGTIVSVGAFQHSLVNSSDLNNTVGVSSVGQVSVYQYQNTSRTWVPMGKTLYGDTAEERFGFSVSLDSSGLKMAVGSAWGKFGQGSVSVFKYNTDSNWTQIGQFIHGKKAGDQFGWSVSLSPDARFVAAGARFNDDNGNNTGQVRIFEHIISNSSWVQKGSDINGYDPHEEYGKSVSFAKTASSQHIVACGGPRNNNERGVVEMFGFW